MTGCLRETKLKNEMQILQLRTDVQERRVGHQSQVELCKNDSLTKGNKNTARRASKLEVRDNISTKTICLQAKRV